jgi:hypothetical protein
MPSKLSDKLQKLPFARMIYPAITLVFVIAVLILFSKTIFFLTTNINKVFPDSSASFKKEITQFDQANYDLIRKRFGWPELPRPSSSEALALPAAPSAAAVSTSTVAAAAASPAKNTDTPQVIAEKKAITIIIFNGPGGIVSGEVLQDALNQSGFTNSKIGSHQLVLKNTIIQFKAANKNLQKYSDEIKKVISDKYPLQAGSDLPDDSEYDVSILIGRK